MAIASAGPQLVFKQLVFKWPRAGLFDGSQLAREGRAPGGGGGGCEGQEVRRDGLFVPTEGGNEEVSFKLRGIPKGTLGVPSASHKIKSTLYPSTDLRSRAAVYPSPMSRALLPLVQRLTAGR